MTKIFSLFLILLMGVPAFGQENQKESSAYEQLKSTTMKKLKRLKPGKFDQFIPGMKTRIVTRQKIIALTFDACGGPTGSGYDTLLIDFLKKEKIPATLFISGQWIEKNDSVFRMLCKEPLFEIENHGRAHQPCSITAASKYGIAATGSASHAYDEIAMNASQIELYTHRKPQLYRPAAAAADGGCVAIARELKESIVSYDVLSEDAVVGVPADVIRTNIIKKSRPGSIVIMHMNHPERNGFEALRKAVPLLRERGFRFVRLAGYTLAGKK